MFHISVLWPCSSLKGRLLPLPPTLLSILLGDTFHPLRLHSRPKAAFSELLSGISFGFHHHLTFLPAHLSVENIGLVCPTDSAPNHFMSFWRTGTMSYSSLSPQGQAQGWPLGRYSINVCSEMLNSMIIFV